MGHGQPAHRKCVVKTKILKKIINKPAESPPGTKFHLKKNNPLYTFAYSSSIYWVVKEVTAQLLA